VYVKNVQELVNHGEAELRRELLNAIETALENVDPYKLTKKLVGVNDGQLVIGNLQFDLRRTDRIYVIGAGKATFPVAKALEEILGDKISEGLIIVKEDEKRTLSRIKVRRAGHPIPSEAGYLAAQEIVKMASEARDDDLYLVAFTGGCSALMPYPVKGVSLEDKRQVTRLLLTCGATIREINAVRKHLSGTKGGRLAKIIAPATIVNLTVSDVIGDPLDCITDPTVIDSSRFEDAIYTLKKYDLWDIVPESVRNHLSRSSQEQETLREYGDLRVHNFIIANNVMAAEAARKHLETRGFNSQILTTSLEGESREVGYVLASILSETVQHDRPLKKPVAYVLAGETLVKLEGNTRDDAIGGPSQELAVAAAVRLPETGHIAGVFLDTDGSDGPTEYAGALIDSKTREQARKLGIDLYTSLKEHNVTNVLNRLDDAILTGATGANVMDLAILIAK
jgi:glycerate-2-kinase